MEHEEALTLLKTTTIPIEEMRRMEAANERLEASNRELDAKVATLAAQLEAANQEQDSTAAKMRRDREQLESRLADAEA